MCVICNAGLRGGRPAWSTAVGLGPIPYRFAGSNPAPRTQFPQPVVVQMMIFIWRNCIPNLLQMV